ncbi:MAG: hypothetical protein JJU00_15385 [Opitutales bacterium]|nr:hypothetical protein [Opitutales bacterium]
MSELSLEMRARAARLSSLPVVIGFDGFVDEMITVVKERKDLENFTPVPDIKTFGGLISAAAGHSSLREITVNNVDPGGCAVNMGDGLLGYGIPVDLFATLGDPVHPAFAAMTERCRSVYSWGDEPGRTLAFEFTDGKLMFSAVRQLGDFDAAHVRGCLKDGAYAAACKEAGLIAMTNWSLYPRMTEVWRVLADEVFGALPSGKRIFIDLVDPSSRSGDDIRAMLETLPLLAKGGAKLTLGVNGNEANLLCGLLGLEKAENAEASVAEQAKRLRASLGIDEVVVHWIRYAAVSGPEGDASAEGPFCAMPRKSTGAGDRFNAGYALGLLLDFPPRERLRLAAASSGFFVREARSASVEELAAFLERWERGGVKA